MVAVALYFRVAMEVGFDGGGGKGFLLWLDGCCWGSDGMAKGLYSCEPLVDVETVVVLSGKGKLESTILPLKRVMGGAPGQFSVRKFNHHDQSG